MWMEIWGEMMGSWAGVASLVVILLSALAIPAAILWALQTHFKGPIELAHEAEHPAPEKSRSKARRGYAH